MSLRERVHVALQTSGLLCGVLPVVRGACGKGKDAEAGSTAWTAHKNVHANLRYEICHQQASECAMSSSTQDACGVAITEALDT